MKQKEYRTRRLVLRTPRVSDYAAWRRAALAGDKAKDKFDRDPLTRAQANKRFFVRKTLRFQRQARQDKFYLWRVIERKSGAMLGWVELDVQTRDFVQCAYIGYRIINAHWGKGFGREACRRLLRVAFEDLGFNRVEAVIDEENRRSITLARKIGMRREGVRKRYYFQHGAYADQVIYVVNPEDLGLKPRSPK